MALISHDKRLIKTLTVAIVNHPRAALKELAGATGVSRAILYRLYGMQDSLVQMLEGHGETILNQATQACNLGHTEPLETLQRLVEEHLTHRELLVPLVFQYHPDLLNLRDEGARWQSYLEASDTLSLRGQQKDMLRIDTAVAMFIEPPIVLIYDMIDAKRRGQAASSNPVYTLEQISFHGASNPARF